jgi:hypothetical protein
MVPFCQTGGISVASKALVKNKFITLASSKPLARDIISGPVVKTLIGFMRSFKVLETYRSYKSFNHAADSTFGI